MITINVEHLELPVGEMVEGREVDEGGRIAHLSLSLSLSPAPLKRVRYHSTFLASANYYVTLMSFKTR